MLDARLARGWRPTASGMKSGPQVLGYAACIFELPGSTGSTHEHPIVAGERVMNRPPVISVMLAVTSAAEAAAWYQKALGASELWNLGSVVGLEVAGAPFFVGEPERNGWESPARLGITSARIEVMCDDPDQFIRRAVEAGADGSLDPVTNHVMPWGIHRQGGFVDPFGHIWLVGDRSPLGETRPGTNT